MRTPWRREGTGLMAWWLACAAAVLVLGARSPAMTTELAIEIEEERVSGSGWARSVSIVGRTDAGDPVARGAGTLRQSRDARTADRWVWDGATVLGGDDVEMGGGDAAMARTLEEELIGAEGSRERRWFAQSERSRARGAKGLSLGLAALFTLFAVGSVWKGWQRKEGEEAGPARGHDPEGHGQARVADA